MSTTSMMRLNNSLFYIERILNYLSAILIMLMMLIITLNVVMRYFFNSPLPGTYETSELMMLGLIFLGLSYVECMKKNIRVTFVYDAMPGSIKKLFDIIILIISLIFWGLFTYQSFIRAMHSWEIREFTLGVIEFPLYPAWIILPVGACCLSLRVLINLIIALGSNKIQPAN